MGELLLQRAFAQGSSEAAVTLAEMARTQGHSRRAAGLFEAAIAQGDARFLARAAVSLGRMLEHGVCVCVCTYIIYI